MSGRGMSRNRMAALALAVATGLLLASNLSAGVNSWTRGFPGGGQVGAVAVDPSGSSVVYAAINGQGVYRSADGGTTWSAASGGLPGSVFSSLLIDPLDPATLYAATFGFSVYRSTDAGASFGMG